VNAKRISDSGVATGATPLYNPGDSSNPHYSNGAIASLSSMLNSAILASI
jgi:hypothetical protein